jgi:CDP-4-dehydro-6-deoxyglucose reductase
MAIQVTISPSQHVFSVEPGEAVLEAALRQGFTLPYGCRNGACGSCKGKILQGAVDYGVYQESALSETEKQTGMALFCQAKPLSDLIIECREISAVRDIPIRKLPCRVQKMEQLAEDVMVLHLKLPANERLQFLAGQYIDILTKEGKRRSFSMANPPHDDEHIQLHVRNVIGGAFAEYVFNKMKARDILRFEGPLGTFFLREDSDKPIIFVASGTGFAPIKGIIEHAFYKDVGREMVFYWGGRKRADLYMMDLPLEWVRQHENFSFVPVLSESPAEENWQGRIGLVHQAVMEDFADLGAFQVYACGAPVMVEAARRDFTALRTLPLEEFYSDAFTFSNDPKRAA